MYDSPFVAILRRALVCLVLISAVAIAQEPKPKTPPARPTPEEIAKLIAPGPEHEKLAGYAGDWTVAIKMGGGKAAVSSEGTAKSRMTTGGRFLFIEYEAKEKPTPVEGTFTLGFDSRHEHFTLMETDSFGTYFLTSQGKRDADTGKLRLLGTDDDPMMKAMGLTKEFLHVIDFRDKDEFAVEIRFVDTRTPARKEIKMMEYVFRRKPQ